MGLLDSDDGWIDCRQSDQVFLAHAWYWCRTVDNRYCVCTLDEQGIARTISHSGAAVRIQPSALLLIGLPELDGAVLLGKGWGYRLEPRVEVREDMGETE